MRLYVVRHGEAESQAPQDDLRRLTDRGRDRLAALWTALHEEGIQPTMLVVSPYVRAQQTADVIAGYYPGVARQDCLCLTPDDSPQQVLDWLASRPVADGWTLVSHMPLVSVLCGLLTGTEGGRVPFGTGTVACIDLEVLAPGGGRLIWQRHTT